MKKSLFDYSSIRGVPLEFRTNAQLKAIDMGEKDWPKSPYGGSVIGRWFRDNFTCDYTKRWARNQEGEPFILA